MFLMLNTLVPGSASGLSAGGRSAQLARVAITRRRIVVPSESERVAARD